MHTPTSSLVIADLFDLKDLVSRPLADELFVHIQSCIGTEVAIDFSGISTVSRAFADQFYKNQTQALANGKTLIAQNRKPEVEAMFKAVSETQGSFNREFKSTPILKFHSREELEGFLHSF